MVKKATSNPLKLVFSDEEYKIKLGNEISYTNLDELSEDDNEIQFIFNLAPEGIEDVRSIRDFLIALRDHQKYLSRINEVVNIGLEFSPDIHTDFYWREGDLNVYLDIPIEHPHVQEILRKYAKKLRGKDKEAFNTLKYLKQINHDLE